MAIPWPNDPPTDAHRAAFSDATARPYWLDALPARDPQPTSRNHLPSRSLILECDPAGPMKTAQAEEAARPSASSSIRLERHMR
jgi:hypothetical protein